MLQNTRDTAFTVPEEGGIYQEGAFLDRKNFLQFRKCFLSPRQKLLFFKENPVWFFISGFVGVFIFHHWFLPLFFVCFHCWLHFFMWLTFFVMTAFLLLFCQVLRFGVAVPLVLRIWESFFFSQAFFTLHFFPTFTIVPRVLRIWEGFFTLWCFLPYTLSRHFAKAAFIKTSLGADSSSLEVAWPPIEVWNIDPSHLFVWITQCSAKVITWQVLYMF